MTIQPPVYTITNASESRIFCDLTYYKKPQ